MTEVDVVSLTGAARTRLLNRLLRHIDIVLDERGCWEWRAARIWNGYGKVQVGGKSRLAHRVLYELTRGPIPDGLDLDHVCRNRACVKPAHMEPVTRGENMRRSPLAGVNKTHCPRGHAYDEGNTYVNATGRRWCRACNRAAVAAYKAKKRSAL